MLEGFSIIGVNHRTCPVAVRERLAFAASEVEHALSRVRCEALASEAVLLSTCNRTELYAYAGNHEKIELAFLSLAAEKSGFARHDLKLHLYSLAGDRAVAHLFEVASGLDSLVVGESEILGQVKEAFRLAQGPGNLGGPLYSLFERSFRAAKRVRSQTGIARWAVSVASVAAGLARKVLGELAEKRALVIGVGEMGEKILAHLVEAGCLRVEIASRNLARVSELAGRFGAEVIAYDEWPQRLSEIDILMTSSAARHILVTREHVEGCLRKRRHKPLLIVDIAVPRNVDPAVGELADVYLYNIDDLQDLADQNMRKRQRELTEAKRFIEEDVQAFDRWLKLLGLAPTVKRLHAYFDELFEAELKAMASRGLALDGGEQETLRRSFERLKARCLHQPLEALRSASRNGSLGRYTEALHELFGLDSVKVSDESAEEPD